MLCRLTIRNYAIIEDLEIAFSPQLNVITGETGAGKSILLGALGLILGERADSSVLVNREKKCVVEGTFRIEGNELAREFLAENDLDLSEELVIRREISSQGKSRAFINDTPVNLSQLHGLTSLLVDLHQQFDTLGLARRDFQLGVLDALAANTALLREYRNLYREWQVAGRVLDGLREQKLQLDREADYNRFQFNELEEAALATGELEQAEAELELLQNAEAIREALVKACYSLRESDTPIVQELRVLIQSLSPFRDMQPGLAGLTERLHSAQVELADIAAELNSLEGRLDWDAEKLDRLNARISLGQKLLKKHGARSTADLLAIRDELGKKLLSAQTVDDSIHEHHAAVTRIQEKLTAFAARLSDRRQKQVKSFTARVNELLVQVGMPNARLKVHLSRGGLNNTGMDEVEFLLNANVAGGNNDTAEFMPVGKVASGGELGRLMLCIKSLVASSMDLPTMIFDEIDTGISGEAARQVGIIMKDLASARQVICITHQPQIAGKASAHFFVYKQVVQDRVQTGIRLLDPEERITAIARMLSGEKPTAAALENAREMIMN